eukprot:TRINITY_DN1450_c0_g1_i2.p1 TRINITY_DN1450_c0_g1~~TRINITY_DN1450_c0_g1_i2.p1  ORF type:complete len:160 (-),score=32.26 TRINITY_DN1450_c0_g1_i2:474-953(-)
MAKQYDAVEMSLISQETCPTFPGVCELLHKLHARNIPLVAVSNATTANTRHKLEVHHIDHLVTAVLGSDTVTATKPQPDGILQALRIAGATNAAACWMVGDSPCDGQAAHAAGVRAVAVAWGQHTRDTLAPHFDAWVEDASALERLLLPGNESIKLNEP